jgi:hypothetical protein
MLSNGVWHDEDRIDMFVDLVLERETWFAPRVNREPMTTREQVLDYIATGRTIAYDSDWYAEIRDLDAFAPVVREPVKMVLCSCGHEVPSSQVMNASRGTACPDCYDRMSD